MGGTVEALGWGGRGGPGLMGVQRRPWAWRVQGRPWNEGVWKRPWDGGVTEEALDWEGA